jgi:hypothetical protein
MPRPASWRTGIARLALAGGFVLASLVPSPSVAGAASPPSKPAIPSSIVSLGQRLFADMTSGQLGDARTLFFPEAAYIAMKTGQIPDPRADFENRLWAFFTLDFNAYHAYLGSVPATLLRVAAPTSMTEWIPPNVCENNVGYWHQPPVRLIYRQGGVVKSFAIDSLISWHGRFYIIHLGPNPRPVNIGTVDSPARGPGPIGVEGGC